MFSDYFDTNLDMELMDRYYNEFNLLSDSEKERLFKESNEGNIESRNYLILCNMKLVFKTISKYINISNNTDNWYANDDLVSIGIMGLIKAINTYKYNKKYSLSTLATVIIRNEILLELRKNKKLKNTISLNIKVLIDKSGDEKKELMDLIENYDNDIEDLIDNIYNTRVFDMANYIIKNKLSKQDAMILEMRYGLNGYKVHSADEISKILGIKRTTILYYISRSLKTIKQIIEKNENN